MAYNRDDFKIRFTSEPTYYVNNEKKIITCKMNGYLLTPRSNSWNSISVPSISITGTGIARCHNDDNFDEKIGKKIARARAENECYLAAKRYLVEQKHRLLQISNATNYFIEKSYRCCAHNDDYIDSLTTPAHPKYKNAKV